MRLVVVGGVAAGLSAASRARRLDPSLEIVVLEKGQRISYGACGLPYLIEGQAGSIEELTVHRPQVFERERDIRIRTGAQVVTIRHPQREVVLSDGEHLHYDRLVWAAGARPERVEHPRAFALHTDEDAARLEEFLKRSAPKTAAVVGGGYIGLEMVGALRARGLAVSLYEAGPHLLHREDPALTARLVKELEKARVAVHLNTAVASLDDLGVDLILTATGMQPNVTVPMEAGVELGRTGAIRVTDRMETNLHGIYAAGDCAETTHLVTGRPVWIPLGTTANKMGRVAGANAAGRRERFDGIVGTSIVRVLGLGVGTTGLSEAQARREGLNPVAARIEAADRPKYFRGRRVAVELLADRSTRRLLGATITGEEGVLGRINVIATALAARMKAEDVAALDLAYSPPFSPVMDPLLIAAQQLLKLLD
jgi:NADPH-dependent 2,4-dienoyl-CoA reductase/sulfur reductase-like enzyme